MIKKLALGILLLGIVTITAIYFVGASALNKGVKIGVETLGPQITKTAVTLDEVKLSPLSGSGTLRGLQVGNPEGFREGNILSLGTIDIQVDTSSVMSDTVIIKKLTIIAPEISYEKKLTTSNVKKLQKNIAEFTGPASEEKQAAEKPDSKSKNILIEELVIADGKIYVGLLGVGKTVPLPRIEMQNIGGSGGDSNPADVLDEILKKVLGSIGPAVAGAGDLSKDAANTLKTQTLEKANQAGKAAADGIKKLFGN